MTVNQPRQGTANRAMRAREAGLYLAALIGEERAFPATTMWRLARNNLVKTVRLGRLVYFRTVDLEACVAAGGIGLNRRGASA